MTDSPPSRDGATLGESVTAGVRHDNLPSEGQVTEAGETFTNVLVLQNGEHFTWIISATDPVAFRFPDESRLRGWSVLSPMMLPSSLGPLPQIAGIEGNRFLVFTQFITVAPPPDIDAHDDAEHVLRWLHLVIGQAELSTPLSLSLSSTGAARLVFERGERIGKPVPDVLENAITFDRMAEGARLYPACDVPTYSEILQDALVACASSDYRKAILYSAIAVEEMAASRLAEEYATASVKEPARFRIVERRTHDRTVRKDPVFEYLQKNAKNNFPLLLDAMALYVLGRSMCDERSDLYAELRRLRVVRNGLAHGSGDDPEGVSALDEEAAYRALTAAKQAFNWFGAPGRYLINLQSFAGARRVLTKQLRQRAF